MPRLSSVVGGLPADTPFVGPEALERRSGVKLEIRLGANESLFGPSERVIEAIRAAALEVQLYGDPEGLVLREAIARQHGVTAENVVLGCGIDELLGLFVRAWLDPGDTGVMSEGGYPTFAYQLRGHGGRFATAPYRGFRNDPVGLAEAANRSGARLVYLSNPDNPTGSVLSAVEQQAMFEALPADCVILLDEAYAEFAPAEALPEVPAEDPRIVRFRTFSKAHGLAGLRIGYALGARSLIQPIERIRNQFGVGRLVQAAALAALGDPGQVAAVVAETIAGRNEYSRFAASLGLRALPSATNFVAIDVGSRSWAEAIVRLLRERHGIFIRMPGVAPLDRCIRVTVGRPPERARFAEALADVLRRISPSA
jgi:histidinol-phosphate aminotransferase